MIIREQEVEVNVLEELEPYLDGLRGLKHRGDEIQACSPFRDESNPSFGVNLDTGMFNDFGGDGYYKNGNLVKLLAFLSDTDELAIEDYLLTKYGRYLADISEFNLTIDLNPKEVVKRIDKEELDKYMYRHKYLSSRGISEKVQRAFQVGYDRDSKAVAFVWHNYKGEPLNIKFRSVNRKSFWYLPDGDRIRNNLYGLHMATKYKAKSVVITESEIDTLYLWSNKIPSIALGSANISYNQKKILRHSAIEEIVLALDNDSAGRLASKKVRDAMLKHKKISKFPIPEKSKDVNEISQSQLLPLFRQREQVYPSFLSL